MNGSVGGPENELAKLFHAHDKPFLLVLDHGECLLQAHCGDSESEAPVLSFASPTVERKMFLLFRDCLDRISFQSAAPFFLVIIVDSYAKVPAEIQRPGRLSRRLTVSIASKVQRKCLLEHFLASFPFASDSDRQESVEILSSQPTSGFTVADVEGFLRRVIETNKQDFTLNDFLGVRAEVVPTSITGRAALKPRSAPFMIGLDRQKAQINEALLSIFTGKEAPRGILLHGPSGCGKSLLARTLASFSISSQHRLPITFIAVDSASLLSKYLGQSERNLAQVFADARSASPCIVFFDQIDALAAKRNATESTNSDRLLTTFLVEMDGFARKQKSSSSNNEDAVIVLATTRNPSVLDPAILRPGRLDLHVEFPIPTELQRREYIVAFLALNRGFRLAAEEAKQLAAETENFTFADLEALFREAALTALRQDINCEFVEYRHFNE